MEWKINNSKYGQFGELSPYEGFTVYLMTQKELYDLQAIAPETLLINIFGKVIPAKDMNDDIRFGYTAAGLLSKMT